MKKKIIWSTLVLFALLCASIWGIRKVQLSDFNRQFHTLNLAIIEDIPSINAIGEHKTSAFHSNLFFFSQQNHAIGEHIEASLNQARANQIGPFAQEWIVLYPKTAQTNLVGVKAYDLIEQRYHSAFLSVSSDKEKVIQTFYASAATGKTITLNDLVIDKESFRNTLRFILEETGKSQDKDLTDFNQKVAAPFETEDWSSIPFQIIGHSLEIKGGSFSLNNFVDSLNPAYFSKETLEQYHEENKALQAMLQSPDTTTIHYD